MERSKAAGSVEVRRVIGALCRLLAGLGVDPVPAPDAFRRAKFGGGPEDSFWLLLSNILQRSGVISSDTICQSTGGSRELVAVGLWQSGYHGDLTSGGSGGSGSDPLLALGWLLAQGVLEKLLAGQVAELDRTLLDTGPATTRTRTLKPAGPDSVSLRTLQWLMGRLRHQGRTLLSTAGGRTRALHDVLSTSQVCSPAPPAGQSSAALTEDSVCVQQLCDVLEAYLSWRRVEDVFWTWMDSVADRRHAGPQSATSLRGLGMCHHGNQGLAQLEQLLMRLPITQETESLRGQRSEDNPACRSPVFSVPSVRQVWRPRLQAGARGPPAAPPALERLLQAERLLLRHKAARRLANRKRLRLLMRQLRRRVFVPL
ncbi:tubulin epsilon and delta complex protein 1 isoform X1 [Xiphophorus hellerii]|uniref:tubulin epsilon and delta complex protein 1 isoform X1 n=1 Tax=Xiphophorus hellerii TaxID=8084 RepID=UPI0013B3A479|nr:tubulin epsilon and delta complex protein 1 isoform X1 [Xiphophorus hellerii]